ncbi:uncharacterized protein [Clytia hemisphaerica]|uniref:Chitin-binding type-2 domain-containing protein n=1 Tax=Clytia hemisphaerica TaxID=252671 RepID=A0A7M6DKW0_9CNID
MEVEAKYTILLSFVFTIIPATSTSLKGLCTDDGNYPIKPYVFKYIQCKDGNAAIRFCLKNEMFVAAKSNCLTTKYSGYIDEFCKGRSDGDWVNPWSCHRFIFCEGEVSLNAQCPLNIFVFSPDVDECVTDSVYSCKQLGPDEHSTIYVSQSDNAQDLYNCGKTETRMPCRTLHFAISQCFTNLEKSNSEGTKGCNIKIDGGSLTNPYAYYIDSVNKAVSTEGFRLTLESLDSNVRPTIKCHIVNGTCNMKIKSSFSLDIKNINFEGEEDFIHQNNLLLQNYKPDGNFVTISGCNIENLQIMISSLGCTIDNSTVSNSRFVYSNTTVPVNHNVNRTCFINSSLMTDGGSVQQSSFWGTFRDENGELSPQILTTPHPEYDEGSGLSIESCTFDKALNGAIESIAYPGDLSIISCSFTDNQRPALSGNKAIVHFWNQQANFTLSKCTFKNNNVPLMSGSNVYVSNIQSVHISPPIRFLSSDDPEYFSLIKMENIPMDFNQNWVLECPTNTRITSNYNSRYFEFFCLPMENQMYSTSISTISWENESFIAQNAPRYKCPIEGSWTIHGIKSKGNYWGHFTKETGKIIFKRCPSTYCCRNIDDCLSYDTCRNERIGPLCSRCPPGYSISIFNEWGCVQTITCENKLIWIFILIDSILITLVLIFSDRTLYLLAYLGSRKTYQKRHRYRNVGRFPENERVRQAEPGERRQIEGRRAGETEGSSISEHIDRAGDIMDDRFHSIDYTLFEEDISQRDILQENEATSSNQIIEHPENQTDEMIDVNRSKYDDNNTAEPPEVPQILCQNQSFIDQQQNENRTTPSTQGMIKILFHFYQSTGLVLLQNPTSFIKLFPVEILVSFFSFKLQMPSLKLNNCPLHTQNIFEMELIKLSVWLIPVFLTTVSLIAATILQGIRNPHNNGNRKIHQRITQETETLPQVSWSVCLKCIHVQLLCFGHTPLTVMLLQFLNSVTIDGKSYHFIDATEEFSYSTTTVTCSIILVMLWCVLFIIALYKATNWLQNCKITPNQFLTIVTLPPLIFVFWPLIKLGMLENGLTESDARIAKHILDTIYQGYCYLDIENAQPKGWKINWECVYLTSRFLLAVSCVFCTNPEDRLKYISIILLMHFFAHQICQPLNTHRLNAVESVCLVSLNLMNSVASIAQFSLRAGIVEDITNVFVALSFAPFIAYVIFRMIDLVDYLCFICRNREDRKLD